MPSADLSVVMANRNHARYLPRALEAVLSQSLPPREVIVLDDASTDDSRKVLDQFASRFPILQIVRNESQCGVTATYNRGFALARCRYLQPIAADDYLLPGFIEKAMRQFARHPEAGVCTAFGSTTEGRGRPAHRERSGLERSPQLLLAPGALPPAPARLAGERAHPAARRGPRGRRVTDPNSRGTRTGSWTWWSPSGMV